MCVSVPAAVAGLGRSGPADAGADAICPAACRDAAGGARHHVALCARPGGPRCCAGRRSGGPLVGPCRAAAASAVPGVRYAGLAAGGRGRRAAAGAARLAADAATAAVGGQPAVAVRPSAGPAAAAASLPDAAAAAAGILWIHSAGNVRGECTNRPSPLFPPSPSL